MEQKYTLELSNINKDFNGNPVLRNISIGFERGKIYAFVGENASGKSTLVRILAGELFPDSGSIYVDGAPLPGGSISASKAAGLGVMFEHNTLFDEMTVLENVMISHFSSQSLFSLGWRSQPSLFEKYEKLARETGFYVNPSEKVSSLSREQRRIVELLKLLSTDPHIIIMDTPTYSLTEAALPAFFQLLSRLRAQGRTIIYFTHNLQESLSVSDSIIVLRNSAIQHVIEPGNIDEKGLLGAVAGMDERRKYPKLPAKKGRCLLKAASINGAHLNDMSFEVYEREIIGFYGVTGSCKSNVGKALFGLDPVQTGVISVYGVDVEIKHPMHAISKKIGYISSIVNDNLVPQFSPEKNITLSGLNNIIRHHLLNAPLEQHTAKRVFKNLNINSQLFDVSTSHLSNGVKQKVAIAKSLYSGSRILIFDEPTQFIDSASKSDVYNLMTDYVMKNNSIILISSDLDEIVGMSDRIYVVQNGSITGELLSSQCTKEAVLQYIQ